MTTKPFHITMTDKRLKDVMREIVNIKNCFDFQNTTRVRGYHFTFNNGYLLSVQFGWGNYCDNRDLPYENNEVYTKSTTAEIAYWYVDPETGKDGEMIYFENRDTVLGYQTFEEVLEWMKKISAMEPQ